MSCTCFWIGLITYCFLTQDFSLLSLHEDTLPPLNDPYRADPNVIFLNVTPIKNLRPPSVLPPLVPSPNLLINGLYFIPHFDDFTDNINNYSITNFLKCFLLKSLFYPFAEC